MVVNLLRMGVKVREFEDGFEIEGGWLRGVKVEIFNDYRIVMVMSIVVFGVIGLFIIEDMESVFKLYLGFFDDLRRFLE